MLPKTVLGIMSFLMITGFFISSLTGDPIKQVEFFADNTTTDNPQTMSVWDKLGVFFDLLLTTIATLGASVLTITVIFAYMPAEFNIIAGLLMVALALALVGKVIK